MLYRTGIGVGGRPERVEIAGFGAMQPATSPGTDGLAFKRDLRNLDVYRQTAGRPPQPIVTSSFLDINPAISPDGLRLAFCTSRSTEGIEVWVSSADGFRERQLTHGPGSWQCSPRWSPDGKTIAFDSDGGVAGGRQIWTIDADGGTPTQLTTGAGAGGNVPFWSHDGAWIYFSRDRAIWRVNVHDRHVERMTTQIAHEGEAVACAAESADGKELLYEVPGPSLESPVVAMPIQGGPVRQVVPCAWNDGFVDLIRGFYYIACGESGGRRVHVLDHRTGVDRVLLTLDRWDGPIYHLPVSPDGTSVYYTKNSAPHADLMLIEHLK
jgi:dipeptidyl aminopeptidase/acylaminoacyl peptidase